MKLYMVTALVTNAQSTAFKVVPILHLDKTQEAAVAYARRTIAENEPGFCNEIGITCMMIQREKVTYWLAEMEA